MASYLPLTDGGLLNWATNFDTQIVKDPPGLGLTPDEVASYAVLREDYANRYAAATQPETRGGATILAKNDAKKPLVAESRKLAMKITNNPAVSDQQRYDLGLTVKDDNPTPIGPPEEMPVLRVASVTGRVLDLAVRRTDGTTKQKPAGVRAVWLRSHVGEVPPQVLSEYEFRGESTKSNPQIVFAQDVVPGTPVWVTALWVNPTGQPGPACAPVKTHINYEGLSEAA